MNPLSATSVVSPSQIWNSRACIKAIDEVSGGEGVTMKVGISLILESDIDANFSGLVYRELRDGTGRACWAIQLVGKAIVKTPPWKLSLHCSPNVTRHLA